MNLGQAINGPLVVARACVAPQKGPRPRIHAKKCKAILEALADGPRSFHELQVVTRSRRSQQLSALLSYLRKRGKVGQDGSYGSYRYRLAA